MHAWQASHAALPSPWSEADASEFLALAKGNHGDYVSDEDFVTQFVKLCTAMGGIVAQEIMKACSGKFMPIFQ